MCGDLSNCDINKSCHVWYVRKNVFLFGFYLYYFDSSLLLFVVVFTFANRYCVWSSRSHTRPPATTLLCSALTFSWLQSHLTLFLFTLKLPSRTFWQPRSLIEKTLNLIRCKLYNTWKIEHWQVELSKCVVFKFEGSWSNYSVLRHRVFIIWICKSSSLDIYLDIWMWNVD